MRDPSRVRVGGPLRRYAGGFREELEGQGYSPSTVVLHLQLMGHLSGWLAGEGLSGAALTGAQVDRYLAGRRSAGLACHRTRRSLLPLLGYLGGLGVLSAPAVSEPVPEVLAGYADYLRYERGLADSTIRRNVELVEPLVATLASGGEFGWERLDGAAVSAFVVAHCRGRADGGGSPARMFTALRSLLRFVHLAGLVGTPLVDAVPSVPCRRLAGLPKALSVEQVAALLGSCDTGTMWGVGTGRSSRCWPGSGYAPARSPPCGSTTSTGATVKSPCGARETDPSGCRCRSMSGARSWRI